MGKIHDNRLTIAPAFYYSQVDLVGPFSAISEHNHRSTVKIWGLVFKDTGSGAISVHAMQKYNTPAFVQAYIRFSCRFGHPYKLFIDEGSQLVKGCRDLEYSWSDISKTLNTDFRVGIEYATCPVGGHNAHGMVERSIREIRKLFTTVYTGIKIDVLSYETAFQWMSNEVNNLPICLGSKYSNLDHLDLITPSRLIHGRNNRRAPGGYCRISSPSRLINQIDMVFESWWNVWKTEKLTDFIPQPSKWNTTGYQPKPGDIVVFPKEEKDKVLGEPVWRTGRVKDVDVSKDGIGRSLIIEYRNANENVFRTTRRSVRRVAVVHREGDLALVEQLNQASRTANISFITLHMKVQN